MDLVDLHKRPEGRTLEFKRDLSSSDGALKPVVAFAITAGGALLIGIDARRAWAGATLSSILISTLTLLRLGATVALKKPEEASEATTIEGAGRPRRVRRAAPKRRAK
jgi:hypothetical protein